MIRRAAATLLALACLTTTACTMNRYPIALAWEAAESDGLTCAQLASAADETGQIRARIEAIAAGDPAARAERPRLYSMAKSDADRAVQARLAAIDAQSRAQGCA